jgi:hypothetical protein
MGLVPDPASGRKKVCWALIFTACYSRHCFVWLSFRQSTEAVIAGFEAAWGFFEGVFRVVVPDNMATTVERADPIDRRLNQVFVEYAQARGFLVDPAKMRKPTDKPRFERVVPFVRGSLFAGENLIDLADAQERAEDWCRPRAGQRVHGTTAARPAEGPGPARYRLLPPATCEVVLSEHPNWFILALRQVTRRRCEHPSCRSDRPHHGPLSRRGRQRRNQRRDVLICQAPGGPTVACTRVLSCSTREISTSRGSKNSLWVG